MLTIAALYCSFSSSRAPDRRYIPQLGALYCIADHALVYPKRIGAGRFDARLPFGSSFLSKQVACFGRGTYTYESPEYATVQSGLDSNLNGDSAGDRVIVNPAGAANVGSGLTGYNAQGPVATSSGTIVAYVANNSNARYIVASSGALANGGRNTFPLHPIDNIDIAVKKRFTIRERYSFDIGAQFYNILNHPQFTGGYTNDVRTNSFINARNDLVPNDPLFGRFGQFYTSHSRVVQVSAHIVF